MNESSAVNDLERVEMHLSNLRCIAESERKLAEGRSKMQWAIFAGAVIFFVAITGVAIKAGIDFSQFGVFIYGAFFLIGFPTALLLISVSRAHQKHWLKLREANDRLHYILNTYAHLEKKGSEGFSIENPVGFTTFGISIKKSSSIFAPVKRWANCGLQIAILAVVIYVSYKIVTFPIEPPQSDFIESVSRGF
jgi:hypothetical protein